MSTRTSARGRLKAPFDTAVFLGLALSDVSEHLTQRDLLLLREALDPCAVDTRDATLWSTYVGDFTPRNETQMEHPGLFRDRLKRLLSDADCMDDIGRYAALRQMDALVSKLPAWGASTASERRLGALEKFHASERSCRRANKRISYYRAKAHRLPRLVGQVIHAAQLDIFRCLGAVPCNETLFSKAAFGPGLTFGLTGERRNLVFKIAYEQTVTPEAKPLAVAVLRDVFPHWASFLAERVTLQTVRGNRVTFVPKSSSIDRTIGIEPSLNVFLQKGVDTYLASRLRLLGLRLNDQQYSSDVIRHQKDVSTIDLSSASDSVAIEAVRWLLPPDWFALLDVLRSKEYTLDKGLTWTRYEKFSSMGNATTFPLESLLFMSLARAACQLCGFSSRVLTDKVRVYGDDIIVPWEAAALLIEVLQFLGFSTNTDKTFVFGPFRETCGVDILRGVNVRPVYLRSVPTRAWHVANLFNRLLTNQFGFTFKKTLPYLYNLVDRPLWGPAYFGWSSLDSTEWSEWYAGRNSEGDAYFFAPHGHHSPVVMKRQDHPTELYWLSRWSLLRRKLKGSFEEQVLYLAFLLGVEGGQPVDHNPIVGVTERLYVGTFPQLDYWPAVYAAPRQPSDRVLRQITGAVIGNEV